MKFIKTAIPDVYIIEPSVFGDDRGYFLESFNLDKFKENIYPIKFVQDNESKSYKGVAVDIRKRSPTYGKHIAVELSGENKRQLFVPRGFAHGYCVLSEIAVFAYKVDNSYNPESDSGIRYDDQELNIDWGISAADVKLSEKDKNLSFLKDFVTPFKF